ncbi:MAG TPA: ABC transporter permease [Acidimicrobiia bacterium]|jgi:ABC-2 type transport system permease protein
MLSLIGTELVKQVRRARTWVALGFVVFVPVLMTVILKLNPPSPGPGGGQFRPFFLGSLQTGLLVPATSLFLMSRIFIVIVMALFVGDAVASEAAWGNLRFMLVRPITRGRLLAAKLVSAVLFASAAVLLVALAGLVVGVISFGWHPLDLARGGGFGGGPPPGFGAFRGVTQQLTQSEGVLLWHTLLAVVLIAWGLAAVLAFGFMLSTMTDSPVGASFGAVGFFIVMGILDSIDSLGSIRHALPVDYYDAWTDLFMRNKWTADMTRSALLQVPYVIVFLGVAWWWFHRKDITS